jgi:predicted outer membrane repeat protein
VGFFAFRSTATAGGAVFFRPDGPATALIEQCVFTGGSGRWGGAVSFEGDGHQVIVRSCIFTGNRATEFDGGALSLGRTPALVEGCEFRQNSAPTGGGAVHSFHGAAELRACLFEGNNALPAGAGGAVSARVGLKVTGCSFVGNQARAGGALFLNQMRTPDPGAVLINSTFSGNIALTAAGGAIYAIGTDALLRHCTVTLNQANKNGAADAFISGGGFAVPGAANVNRLQLHNCVVAGNLLNGPGPAAGTDLHGPAVSYISLGGNVIGIADTLAAVFNQPGDKTGTLAAPLAAGLAPLAAAPGQWPAHGLLLEAPALDTGVAGPEPAILVDQLGAVRPSGPAADAGAVEVVVSGG